MITNSHGCASSLIYTHICTVAHSYSDLNTLMFVGGVDSPQNVFMGL